ncbi:N-acetyllactosaminide beta-1,3-N-acetylglucosaminyltransferase 2 [Aplochiton taeniatus]
MVHIHCRWWRVMLCLCSPCIVLALLFMYIAVMICFNMATVTSVDWVPVPPVLTWKAFFVAPGTNRTERVAPVPAKDFWDPQPHKGALWNRLQIILDRQHNPILNPVLTKTKRGLGNGTRSQLDASLSEIGDLESHMVDFVKLPEQLRKFVSSMKRRSYPLLIDPANGCGAGKGEQPALLLFAIKTTALNFENRQAIRQTWGKEGWVAWKRGNASDGGAGEGAYVRRVFLLGKKGGGQAEVDVSQLLALESRHYGDILQWDFQDTFFNLTIKDVLFWDWFSRRCPQARFVFKGDDDVFVNTPAMLGFLQDQLGLPKATEVLKDFMIGEVIGGGLPNRESTNKYFVSSSFYRGLYPAYAGGGGVIYSGALARRLARTSQRVHLFPIDDVFVGMCMVRMKAHPIHHPGFLTFDLTEKEEGQPCAYHEILLVHKRSPAQIAKLWAELHQTQGRFSFLTTVQQRK